MSQPLKTSRLDQLPPEMLSFAITSACARSTPRLGLLRVQGRKDIATPNFIGNTSRGAIPHITPDVQAQHVNVNGLYMPVEDSQPSDTLLVLGPRRPVPVDAPMTNSKDAFTVYTSVGFRRETVGEYITAAGAIGPDVFIGPADIVWADTKSQKRIEKMSDRTEQWMKAVFQTVWGEKDYHPAIFAPILPVLAEQQRFYLEVVAEHADQLGGLAIYDPVSLDGLPGTLSPFVRLSLSPPSSPQEILRHIALGVDIFTVPFIAEASDAGIALTFSFPPSGASEPTDVKGSVPLGVDMFPIEHATSVGPIDAACECYACKTSSRAYVQHLLSAKEMTGWVLLQIHNHAALSTFFASVRKSIEKGSFEEDTKAFEEFYAVQLPAQSGAGPRSEGPNEKKRNPLAFRKDLGLEDHTSGTILANFERLAESSTINQLNGSVALEEHGLGSRSDV